MFVVFQIQHYVHLVQQENSGSLQQQPHPFVSDIIDQTTMSSFVSEEETDSSLQDLNQLGETGEKEISTVEENATKEERTSPTIPPVNDTKELNDQAVHDAKIEGDVLLAANDEENKNPTSPPVVKENVTKIDAAQSDEKAKQAREPAYNPYAAPYTPSYGATPTPAYGAAPHYNARHDHGANPYAPHPAYYPTPVLSTSAAPFIPGGGAAYPYVPPPVKSSRPPPLKPEEKGRFIYVKKYKKPEAQPANPYQTGPPCVYTVAFKRTNKEFVLGIRVPATVVIGDAVIVATERGEDLGFVNAIVPMEQYMADRFRGTYPPAGFDITNYVGRILRVATPPEVRMLNVKSIDEAEILKHARHLAMHFYRMDIDLFDAEYQFDRFKITLYYDSAYRVDLRDFVHDLTTTYNARIWMELERAPYPAYPPAYPLVRDPLYPPVRDPLRDPAYPPVRDLAYPPRDPLRDPAYPARDPVRDPAYPPARDPSRDPVYPARDPLRDPAYPPARDPAYPARDPLRDTPARDAYPAKDPLRDPTARESYSADNSYSSRDRDPYSGRDRDAPYPSSREPAYGADEAPYSRESPYSREPSYTSRDRESDAYARDAPYSRESSYSRDREPGAYSREPAYGADDLDEPYDRNADYNRRDTEPYVNSREPSYY